MVEVTDATADPVASALPGTPTGLTAEKYSGNPDRYVCVARWQFVSGDFEGLNSCERPPPTIPEEYKQLQFSKTNIIVHWDRTDDPSILHYEVQWSKDGTTWNDASPHAGALNHYKYGYEWSGGFWYDESEAGYETTLDTGRINYRVRAVNSAGESDWSSVVGYPPVWSATMTVGSSTVATTLIGWEGRDVIVSDDLTDADFVYKNETYALRAIVLDSSTGVLNVTFEADNSGSISDADVRSVMALHVDGVAFALGDAIYTLLSSGRHVLKWDNTGLGWAAGGTVRLEMRVTE